MPIIKLNDILNMYKGKMIVRESSGLDLGTFINVGSFVMVNKVDLLFRDVKEISTEVINNGKECCIIVSLS